MATIADFYSDLKNRSDSSVILLTELNINNEPKTMFLYSTILKTEVNKIFGPKSLTYNRCINTINADTLLLNLLKIYKTLIADGFGNREATSEIHLRALFLAQDMNRYTFGACLEDYEAFKKDIFKGDK